MTTELPAQRLHRRLGGEVETEPDADGPGDGGRPDTALSKWLPEDTGAAPGWLATMRADPGRAGVVTLAVVGVIAVLVTVFSLMRDSTPPIAAANLPPVQMVSSAAPTAAGPDPAAPVVVSVVGLVHEPGLVTLTSGARIADALQAAGGALDGADLIGLNMARRVSDGEQILVGIAAPQGQPATLGSSVSGTPDQAPVPVPAGPGAPADTGTVNLNTATADELDTLPGVGPVTAEAIISWRTANGAFSSVDQLGEVDGIGPARLAKLRGLVQV